MKYSENFSDKKPKLGSGFYIIIAVCLLIVGGVAWFTLSRFNDNYKEPPKEESKQNEYNNDDPSYNETLPPMKDGESVTEQTSDNVKNEPYKEPLTETPAPIAFGMPVEGEILKNYSDKELQYSSTFGDMRLHEGIDIACNTGTSVTSSANGTVTDISLNTNMGNTVTIDHENGITVKYSSIDNLKVKKGDKVSLGDLIGTAGTVTSECNDEPHIHLEILKDGKLISPLEILK